MATETLKTAWLDDENGVKFAPKTLIESIQDAEGTSLDDRLASAGMSAEVEGTRLKFGTGGGASSEMYKYSTTEQVVGEWIDGKPIYEITIMFDNPLNLLKGAWKKLDNNNYFIKNIIKGFLFIDGGNIAYPLSFSASQTSNELSIFSLADLTVNGYNIQYTKTTD